MADNLLRSEEITENIVEKNGLVEETKKTSVKENFLAHRVYIPIIFILIGAVTWLAYQVDKLEKSQIKTQNELTVMVSDMGKRLGNAETNIKSLSTRANSLQSDISNLGSDVSRTRSSISSVASTVDAMIPLVENANRYAHSHTYSDVRLKTNIHEIDGSLTKVLQLRGVYYNWNTQDFPGMGFNSDPQIGLIAQDVEKVFPELVTVDAKGYKQVDYERLVPVLVEALKEQQIEIDGLKKNSVKP